MIHIDVVEWFEVIALAKHALETRDTARTCGLSNERLLDRIKRHHVASDGTYGAVRVREDLLEEAPEERIGRHRLARRKRVNGIVGVTRRSAAVSVAPRGPSVFAVGAKPMAASRGTMARIARKVGLGAPRGITLPW